MGGRRVLVRDELPVFRKIVDAYEWVFCRIMCNDINVEFQAGGEGLDCAYRTLPPIPCTDWRYCQPRVSGVAVPEVLSTCRSAMIYGAHAQRRMAYDGFAEAETRADYYVERNRCESVCPQQIKTIDWLKKAHAFLAVPRAS